MADDAYQLLAGEPVPITFGAGTTQSGYNAAVQALTSGVVFRVVFSAAPQVFDDPALLSEAIDGIARPYSGYVNQDVQVPGVVSMGGFQDLDNNQNPVWIWEVTVRATENPDVTATVQMPFTDAIPSRFSARVDTIRASLDTAAPNAPTIGL